MKLYIAKVYLKRELKDVRFYEEYEHFLSDLFDRKSILYESIPEALVFEVDKPLFIRNGGKDELGFSGDFTYIYPEDIKIYCGTILTEEESRRLTRI